MFTRKVAEAIILQAMDDLYDRDEYMGSVEFFSGEGFRVCASMAQMDQNAIIGILEVVGKAVGPLSRRMKDDEAIAGPKTGYWKSTGLHGTH